ncbi:hypothetical protein B0H13DRAFT_2674451 [Mycena leptocephala]|nr:hypothetical protein B0H13DRAFT_2674451 [Mycena leptocephala]
MPRIPLQPVNVNASANYMDFSLLGRPTPVARPLAPSIPPVASENDLDWFTSLSLSQQAALLSSLKPTAMTTSALYDERSSGGQLEEHFDNQSLGGQGHYNLSDLGAEQGGLGSVDQNDEEPFRDQPWFTPSENDGDNGDEPPAPVSSLQFTIRSIEPGYQQKQKKRRARMAVTTEDSEDEDGDDIDGPPKKKQKSRGISVLAADHQKICELAFHYVKRDVTHKLPFPVAKKRPGRLQTDEFTELLLGSWTNAAFDLELENVEPTAEDIALIRARVPQFRSGIKVMARSFVPGVYQFENILTLPDPTPERIHEAMERNRKRVGTVLKTYHHLDPDQPGPGTMFRNVIIQYILTGYWFGENDADRAFYFKDMSRMELATVALILCAVVCAIEEWSTGRWQNKKFWHKNYFDLYQKLVSGLNKWKDHSDKDVREKKSRIWTSFMASAQWELKVYKGNDIPFSDDQKSAIARQTLRATQSANLPERWTTDPEEPDSGAQEGSGDDYEG